MSSSAPNPTSKQPATMVGTTTASPATTAANAAKQQAAAAKMHRRSRTGMSRMDPANKTTKGCFTCRLRRKKCDEGKPACRACKHLGLKCEYKRPMWWSNNEQRRNQKEMIKNIIKRTKLNEKSAQGVSLNPNSPPSLCHSLPTSENYSDGIGCTRAPSVDSQLSLDYNFNHVSTPDFFGHPATMPPPMFAPSFPMPGQFAPYEVDIKTESQMFINDIPTRRDSTISTFSTYQVPPVVGHQFPTENWVQQDYFESRRESFTEEPLDFQVFNFDHQPFSPSHQATIQVEECDQHLLNNFIDNVLRLIFPILEVNQHGSARSDIILPALESNKTFLHCCLSISALHLKATGRVQGEQIDNDIMHHRYATVSELCEALNRDTHHSQILEATLGMTFFQCAVGRPNADLPDIAWHQHFQAATSLIQKLDLPAQLVALNGQTHGQPPFNMTLASWIDILGATMLGKAPHFADTYREKLIASSPSGLSELMGCDDQIMYLISEIACLEALKLEKMDEVQLCAHIKLLGDQISLSEPPHGTVAHAYSATGAIRPKQLSRNMTAVFRLAARIYLCSLVPDFDRTQSSIDNLVRSLCAMMEFIPAGPDGFDRSLVWPILIAGSVSLPTSTFRTMFADRCNRLGDASNFGSFGKAKELLKDVWAVNDAALAKGDKQSVHWRDMMRQKGWDVLLI
ncbi:C6 sexual development transcription factor-like protein NosA [Sporormia fimetaria CBS 119925]|uniref:C6 sexual development transcription factor-like protein NosA n=1 Tax=Sporormia fimetaria CBS 119925 TaxID=1340428 RepID=A0A6A6VIK4_9PLEO|nr:C6 sexual development transcription factor-like protein NosA [Sporormia fimetaria CBS 119925]